MAPHHTIDVDGHNGGSLSILDPNQNERLAPSTVSNYDRRLKVDSPFPKEPTY
jgi:hypothetical protein